MGKIKKIKDHLGDFVEFIDKAEHRANIRMAGQFSRRRGYRDYGETSQPKRYGPSAKGRRSQSG